METQNNKILDLETKLEDNKPLTKEILDEAGKMINKFEEDSSRHHNNYIRELAKSNDLYRQLGEARTEYEERVRRYNEDKIGDEQPIVFLFENLTLLRKLEFEHKHLIEQLVSTFNELRIKRIKKRTK